MPITASFSKTSSPFNRIIKETTEIVSKTIVFKNPTALLKPTILLTSLTDDETLSIFSANYCEIIFSDSSSRKYFIRDIRVIRASVIEIDLTEDVLATYYSEIFTMNLFVSRTSNFQASNHNIKDDYAIKQYIPKASVKFDCSDFSQVDMSSVTGNYEDRRTNGFNNATLGYVTEGYVINVVFTYPEVDLLDGPAYGEFPSNNPLLKGMLSTVDFLNSVPYTSKSGNGTSSLIAYCKQHDSDASSVISIIRYPFEIYSSGIDESTIRLGSNDVSVPDIGSTATTQYCSYQYAGNRPFVLADFYWSYTALGESDTEKWKRGDDTFSLYLPFIGEIPLDVSLIDEGDEIQIIYANIIQTNQCLVSVTNITKSLSLYTNEISLGTEIPLVTSNAESIRDQWISTGVKAGVGAIGDAFKIASANPLAVASGITGLVGSVSNIVTTALTTHSKTESKQTTSVTSAYCYAKPYVVVTSIDYDEDSDYAMRVGYPSMETHPLSRYTSASSDTFVKTDIRYLPSEIGNETERNEIIRLLNQGVLLPPR